MITSKNSIYVDECQDLVDNYGLIDISLCNNDTYYDIVQYVWDIKVLLKNSIIFSQNYDLDFDQGKLIY